MTVPRLNENKKQPYLWFWNNAYEKNCPDLNGISVAVKVLHDCALAASRPWLEFVNGQGLDGAVTLKELIRRISRELGGAHASAEVSLYFLKNELPVLWVIFLSRLVRAESQLRFPKITFSSRRCSRMSTTWFLGRFWLLWAGCVPASHKWLWNFDSRLEKFFPRTSIIQFGSPIWVPVISQHEKSIIRRLIKSLLFIKILFKVNWN